MSEIHLFGPQELYRHWEEGQWSPFEVDLAADAEEIREFALGALGRRLGLIGVPISTCERR